MQIRRRAYNIDATALQIGAKVLGSTGIETAQLSLDKQDFTAWYHGLSQKESWVQVYGEFKFKLN
jgi:hypothetical protein